MDSILQILKPNVELKVTIKISGTHFPIFGPERRID